MAKNYYVLDSEGNTLWHGRDDADKPQSFGTFAAAEKRAKEYADTEPGTEVKIVKIEAVVMASVNKAMTRKL